MQCTARTVRNGCTRSVVVWCKRVSDQQEHVLCGVIRLERRMGTVGNPW